MNTSQSSPGSMPEFKIPTHLAIIMDGNGRWATQRGLPRSEGHKAGTRTARMMVEECGNLGIQHLTLYTFSKENWNRPKEEVSLLFDLLVSFINNELTSLKEKGIQLRVLGDMEKLPFTAKKALQYALASTAANTRMIVNLALNYSGQEEIAHACRECIRQGLQPEEITPEKISMNLYTKEQPPPDLVIRTSGEQRLSNFLPFQTAYSELFFTSILWPDFTPQNLHEALAAYSHRQRRFGGLTPA